MREIKFRGKRVDNGEWVYGYYFTQYKLHFVGRYEGSTFKEVIPETVGQFTGLKDKNGVEVYEGDIIECESYWDYKFPRTVLWDEKGVAMVATDSIKPNIDLYGTDLLCEIIRDIESVVVIGNIHDKEVE